MSNETFVEDIQEQANIDMELRHLREMKDTAKAFTDEEKEAVLRVVKTEQLLKEITRRALGTEKLLNDTRDMLKVKLAEL